MTVQIKRTKRQRDLLVRDIYEMECELVFRVTDGMEVIGSSKLVGTMEVARSVWRDGAAAPGLSLGMGRFLREALELVHSEADKVAKGEHYKGAPQSST